MEKILHYQINFDRPFNISNEALIEFIRNSLYKFHGKNIFNKLKLKIENSNIYIKTERKYEDRIDGALFLIYNYENKICKITRLKSNHGNI